MNPPFATLTNKKYFRSETQNEIPSYLLQNLKIQKLYEINICTFFMDESNFLGLDHPSH